MAYVIKRGDMYLAAHDTPWGWWQPFLGLAVRYALRQPALDKAEPLKDARIVRLRRVGGS